MASTPPYHPPYHRRPRRAALADPGHQAFVILRAGFTVAPIPFGPDGFAGLPAGRPACLAPWIDGIVPGSAQAAMYAVGVVEIAAGVAVAVAPRFGGRPVAGWLAGTVLNLLTVPGRCDVGLLPGAVALARRHQGTRS